MTQENTPPVAGNVDVLAQARELQADGKHREAIAMLENHLAQSPSGAGWSNLGVSLHAVGRLEHALSSFGEASRLLPGRWEPQLGRARVLFSLRRFAQALLAFERAVALDPHNLPAITGKGNALARLHRPQDALACYDLALQIDPSMVELQNNRGAALRDLKRYGEAADAFARLQAGRPHYPYAASNRLHSQLYACDWQDYDAQAAAIVAGVRAGEQVDVPFSFLAICDQPDAQLVCAQRYVSDFHPPQATFPIAPARARGERIRLAYLSADFHEHATSYLMAELLELHDRERFELIALSFGPDSDDAMRRRLLPCFDAFLDARQLGDVAAARLLHERGVDIAVDLKGFTTGNRAGILAHRPAPIQVSYLGYPGTMGAPYIDYLLADPIVAPPAHQPWYSEKLVHLPGSYQVNDRHRRIAPITPTRVEASLPARGVVFCCFNNNYKISPAVFAIWMRLLKRVSGSVLWLIEDNPDAARALRAEANLAGVTPSRLVFAPRVPLPDHLARHALADLFLDTLPCNAHTTASDALWAGLPLLTCQGGAFAGRVAASLVTAAGLPELVCRDLAEYEARALALASKPALLAELRARLLAGRASAALFDTDAFRRNIESAFETMHARRLAGQPPEPFFVT